MREPSQTLREQSLWRPTTALLRSLLGGVVLALAAVAFGRPDLLVLAAPLVIIAGWSLTTRPVGNPTPETSLAHRTLREGEATTLHASLNAVPGMEQAVVALAATKWVVAAPANGIRARTVPASSAGEVIRLDIALQSRRWGRRDVGAGLVAATSSWGAFRYGPHACVPRILWTLPMPATFDAKAPTPHPNGLVGLSRSRRAGDGSEFASIRAFQPGDRLRRIHWPLSLRAGELYVTSTWADQDSHVVLMVDALNDLGQSGGMGQGRGGDQSAGTGQGTSRSRGMGKSGGLVDSRGLGEMWRRGERSGPGLSASSLDVTVRAASAMAEHYLRRGDRVGLRVFGAINVPRLPAMAGRSHLRRVLDTLARIEAGTDVRPNPTTLVGGLPPGTLVVVLSPLISPDALTHAVTLARRGLSVIIIDTLPDHLGRQEEASWQLAWRVRRLEREREIRRVQEAGIPTVPWRGPGSLDQVLRDLGRRSSAARLVRR